MRAVTGPPPIGMLTRSAPTVPQSSDASAESHALRAACAPMTATNQSRSSPTPLAISSSTGQRRDPAASPRPSRLSAARTSAAAGPASESALWRDEAEDERQQGVLDRDAGPADREVAGAAAPGQVQGP